MPRHPASHPYCVRCRLRLPNCVCDSAPRIATGTRIVVIMHAIEWSRSSNTGILTRLVLPNSEIRTHGRKARLVTDADIDTTKALVLFPGRGESLTRPEVRASLPPNPVVLVPDGTWNQAKAMMTRLPLLASARPVHLDDAPVRIGARHNHQPDRRSTFEAIARTLGLLESEDIEHRLLEFWDAYRLQKGGH